MENTTIYASHDLNPKLSSQEQKQYALNNETIV
jgi:hypothetical protein